MSIDYQYFFYYQNHMKVGNNMFYISLLISKLYYFFTKKGVINDHAGSLALKICPEFLNKVKKPKTVIAVTGTNGKTTTCNFLVDILTNCGYKVASNREGANLKPGISKALMKSVSIFNKCKVDIAIIEFDELSSSIILPALKPNYLVVTNLFRDTIKRNAHTEYVFNKLNSGISKDITMILNADDLISSNLGNGNKKVFFSIDKLNTDFKERNSLIQDIQICPNCHELLVYDYIRYHHLGKAHCPKCDFKNYEAKYLLTDIDYKKRTITVNSDKYYLVNSGLFNIYNELVAITVLNELKVTNFKDKLKKLTIVKSRYSNYKINGIEIITQLSKGQAVATSRALDYISHLEGNKEIILLLDDQHEKLNNGNSEIISWIYETDFEYLNQDSIKRIIIGGIRAYDYKIRLELAGIPEDKIFFDLDEESVYKYLDLTDTDKIIVAHDLYSIDICDRVVNQIKEVIK